MGPFWIIASKPWNQRVESSEVLVTLCSHWKRLVPLLQATSRRFSLPPPDSLALLVAGGLCVAGELGEAGIRWVVYISPSIRVHLARLVLGSFASMATRRRVYPGGLGFKRPVLLSLQSISGDCGVGGGFFWRCSCEICLLLP